MGGKKTRLVLFDFDGTLTRKDTLPELLSFLYGKLYFFWGILFLSPILFLYKIKLVPARIAKERLYTLFLKGVTEEFFQEKCDLFVSKKLPSLLRIEAIKRLMQFREEGFEIVVVSASAKNLIASWCKTEHIKYIATNLEVKDGRLTGRLEGENCNGMEKERRIKQLMDLSQYDEIYAYGDSRGDLPMLKLAGPHAYYRCFRIPDAALY